MIGIIDYKVGNLKNVELAVRRTGREGIISDDVAVLQKCSGLILPGVGAFGSAMASFLDSGLKPFLDEWVESNGCVLGICVGMQMLFERSFELGEHRGLGYLPGSVVRFAEGQKIPHMGWNQLWITKPDELLNGINSGEYVYFVHSYYAQAEPSDLLAYTDYGVSAAAIVRRGSIYGTQFHPEKSAAPGARLLNNYLNIVEQGGSIC